MLAILPTTQIIDQDHARVGAWMQAQGAGVYRDGSTCIGLERNGELVAGTLYDFFNGASVFANIAIRGPITREWLWFIFFYPFEQLGASVLLGLIAEENQKSLQLAIRFGFFVSGTVPDADPSGPLHLVTLHRRDCRFLRSPYER